MGKETTISAFEIKMKVLKPICEITLYKFSGNVFIETIENGTDCLIEIWSVNSASNSEINRKLKRLT